MTIDELLTQTAKDMGFTDPKLLSDASRHATANAGHGADIERKLNRDLSADEIVFYRKYMVMIIKCCEKVPGFREQFMKLGAPLQSEN